MVTATRTPVALDAVGAPVIVISRNDIERSMASDVSELLQSHAGLEISRNGGPGQTTSLFTRGTESNHTVVLIDGVRINPGTIGGAALQNIAPESLERIEIVKGPRSSLVWHRSHRRRGPAVHARRGEGRRQRGRHLRQPRHPAVVWRCRRCSARRRCSSASAAAMPRARACRRSSTTTVDRGYRNVTGRALGRVRRDRRADPARARLARHRPHRILRTDFLGTPPYAPASQDFENSVYSLEGEYRAHDGFGVRATRATRSTISISSSRASARRSSITRAPRRTTCRCAGRPGQLGTSLRSRSACSTATKTRAPSPSARCSTRTRTSRRLSCRTSSRSARLSVAARAGRCRSRNLRQRAHLERRARRRVRQRHARDAVRRQGIPRARQHRPLRLRRQSGPRPRSFRAGRVHGPPEVRRTSTALAVRIRQSHRRSHRLRGHGLQHVRRREPQRREGAHQGRRARLAASRAKPGARAPNSRCRIRATKPPTNACCAGHANR